MVMCQTYLFLTLNYYKCYRTIRKRKDDNQVNPVFIILVILLVIALWFLSSFVFFPIGKIIYRIGKDAIDEMNKEENEEKEKN